MAFSEYAGLVPKGKKAMWWEYFRLRDLPDNELFEENAAVADLRFRGQRQQGTKKSIADLYAFPVQETQIRSGDKLKTSYGDIDSFGEVVVINTTSGEISIKKGESIKDVHPTSVFRHTDVPDKEKEESIIRIATWVVENGMGSPGQYQAGRDLLMNLPPRTKVAFDKYR